MALDAGATLLGSVLLPDRLDSAFLLVSLTKHNRSVQEPRVQVFDTAAVYLEMTERLEDNAGCLTCFFFGCQRI